MRHKPQCLKRTVIAQSNLFTIEQMQLKFSNGVERTFERIMQGSQGAVIIAAITDANHLLLVREYAAGTDNYTLAFPKGLIEPKETPQNAANRELQEEVGFASKQLTEIKKMTLAPGYFGASMSLILAQNLYESVLPGDEPEPIEVIPWPLSEWRALLEHPDFTEARSIAALYLVDDWLHILEKQKEK